MYVHFATCARATALRFLQRVYPSHEITDTPDSAGPLLDFVAKDIVRIQDPSMYGNTIGVIPGTKWQEDAAMRAEIVAACRLLGNEKGAST